MKVNEVIDILHDILISVPTDPEIRAIADIKCGGGSPESNDERIGFISGARFLKNKVYAKITEIEQKLKP